MRPAEGVEDSSWLMGANFALASCVTCFWHCCKRLCSYRCPTLPTCELVWFASSDDARQARTMLARAKFAPISLKPRRVKSAKKVIFTCSFL